MFVQTLYWVASERTQVNEVNSTTERLLVCRLMNRNWCLQVCKNILQRL